mgnify:CR=1
SVWYDDGDISYKKNKKRRRDHGLLEN